MNRNPIRGSDWCSVNLRPSPPGDGAAERGASRPAIADPAARVLVIVADHGVARLLQTLLENVRYSVAITTSAATGLGVAAEESPDAIVLDLDLPGAAGLEVLRRLREWSQVPVIAVTASQGDETLVAAFETGADDFLTRPFNGRELVLRVRALLRRMPPAAAEPVVRFGNVELDLAKRMVRRAGVPVPLTRKEYDLLGYMARHAGRAVTHEQLLQHVWGGGAGQNPQYVRIYVTRLRQKLEPTPHRPRFLRTENGVGYRLVLE